MCGVAAIFAYGPAAPPVDERELVAIRDRMRARGPDAAGLWIDPKRRMALGHRRLSIIDLDPRSDQPMVSACGRFRIVFNGEIYNYRSLAAELGARGLQLRTTSDTEVLLELWAQKGPACLPELRGMYAFALYDQEERVLHLARDPFGIKPLYWSDDGGTVRVASQVKALLAGGRVATDIDPPGLVGFHLLGSVPEPFTLYRAVQSVPSGHLVRVDAQGVRTPTPFCAIEGVLAEAERQPPPAVPERVLREALIDSVRHHLVADVPVGVFLSAGIDSAAVLAAIHAIDPHARATTCITVTFPEFRGRPADEAPAAAELARRFGATHRIVEIDRAAFRADLPALFDAMDQPSIDGVNTWLVSKAAVQAGLEVALSGLGGDELLGGYPSFRDVPRWWRILRLPSRVPALGRLFRVLLETAAPAVVRALPKLSGLLEHGGSIEGAWLLRRGLFLPHELPALVGPELAREGLDQLGWFEGTRELLRRGPRASTGRVATVESCLYMRNQLLRDTDWSSMAHSLEVRVPFVDLPLWRRVAPIALRQPGKMALGRAMGLPAAWLERPKTGFSTPVGLWIAGEFGIPTGGRFSRRWAREVSSYWLGKTRTTACATTASVAGVAH